MDRFAVSVLLIALLLPAMPLGAGEDETAIAEAALEAAHERLESFQAELTALYKEIEVDFDLLRSERWAESSGPYLDALALRSAAFTAEPETDPGPALKEEFERAGLLSTVVSGRLAAAAAKALTAKAGPPTPDAALAEAVKAVFPEESFAACWEACFLDLPVVAQFKLAHEEMAAAERRLARAKASSGEKPEVPPGMVLIPRGRFVFGPWKGWTADLKSDKETRARVEAFFIDVHEVTNESYLEFLNQLESPEQRKEHLALGFDLAEDGSARGPEGRELWPVRGVDFASALAFATFHGKSLPTEEEWEKAARGEDGLVYPWGNEPDPLAANAPNEGNRQAAPVGSFPKDKSPYGVMDMAGNVSELTSTFLDRLPYKGRHEASSSIVYRGGNYTKDADSTVAGYRYFMTASSKKEEVGFRCVMSEKAWRRASR